MGIISDITGSATPAYPSYGGTASAQTEGFNGTSNSESSWTNGVPPTPASRLQRPTSTMGGLQQMFHNVTHSPTAVGGLAAGLIHHAAAVDPNTKLTELLPFINFGQTAAINGSDGLAKAQGLVSLIQKETGI
jgi:hypothetical protein